MIDAGQVEFGSLLKQLRGAAGLSQQELAERARISVEAISAYERGVRRAPYRDTGTVQLLVEALGLETSQREALLAAAKRGRRRRPAAAGSVPRHNLPTAPTSFVGRDAAIAEIIALVAQHRLVTLVGSGGIGKTRTALQIGSKLLDADTEAVWFVELAPLANGDYIPKAIADVLGLSLPAGDDAIDRLAGGLRTRRMVLVFDGCEHLIESVGRVIAALQRACPGVKILATSRQPLGLGGEETYRIPSMRLPAVAEELPAAIALAAEAVALFVERAQAVDRRFTLSDENAQPVTEICRRLDGIPLAIELAAARVRVLSPHQLRDRLDERFSVLASGRRDALPRHQTLRALFDWSYELLGERERSLFRHLSTFVDGFTLEGAVALGRGAEHGELDVIDALASLVDKSLLVAEPLGNTMRYHMLESTRAYAREKIATTGEARDCAARHLEYLRNVFVAARARRERSGRAAELDALLALELEDLRAALDWAANCDAPRGAELLAAVGNRWVSIGREQEGMADLERFIGLVSADDSVLGATLWIALSRLMSVTGRFARALEVAAEALRRARVTGDAETIAYALYAYADSAALLRNFEAAADAIAEAEALAPAECVFLRTIELVYAKATLRLFQGDLAAAARGYSELRVRLRALGNYEAAAGRSSDLAEIEHALGRSERAVAIVQEDLPVVRAGSNRSSLLIQLSNLAGYLIALDRIAESRTVARDALRIGTTHQLDLHNISFALEHLALGFALEGAAAKAARLAGYTEAALRRIGCEREFTERRTRARLEAELSARIPAAELAELMASGATLGADDAVEFALDDDP